MNRQAFILAVLALGMIGAAVWRLDTAGTRQRLGIPGVKIANEPIYAYDPLGTNQPVLINTNRVFLPSRVLDYDSFAGFIAPIITNTLPQDTMFGHRVYTNATHGIDFQVVLMGSDRSSIHRPQGCLQGTGWQTISSEESSITVDEPVKYELPVCKLKLRRQVQYPDGKMRTEAGVFIYWFVADGQITAGHGQRMWWMARDLLAKGVLQRWAYIICFSACEPGQEEATFAEQKRFIAASVPKFQLAVRPSNDRADARRN